MQIRAIDLLILCARSLEGKEPEHSEKCIKMLGKYIIAGWREREKVFKERSLMIEQ